MLSIGQDAGCTAAAMYLHSGFLSHDACLHLIRLVPRPLILRI